MKTYQCNGKSTVSSPDDLGQLISAADASYYVYLLCLPPLSSEMVPFYVGIGQLNRLFSHEEDAKNISNSGRKVELIRTIWRQGGEPIRVIDGFFDDPPWTREEELINAFGLEKDGSGILTNEQRFSPSCIEDGIELRKYATDGNRLPENFIRRNTRLRAGPRTPASNSSVYGKICTVLEHHAGITGAELVELLLDQDFTGNKSAYTSSGTVSRPWLAKYIDGGFYKKNEFIQKVECHD